jgi:uncharacterized membrane protein
MDWVVFGAQWLHILLGILWFGNSLALAVVVIPALGKLPLVRQQEVGAELGARGLQVFDIVAPAVIVLGVIRGTLLGPINTFADILGTGYGVTWLVALVAATATFLWGRFVIVPATQRLAAAPVNADGSPSAELDAALSRAKLVTVMELIGFLTIFTCMILMRFGA